MAANEKRPPYLQVVIPPRVTEKLGPGPESDPGRSRSMPPWARPCTSATTDPREAPPRHPPSPQSTPHAVAFAD